MKGKDKYLWEEYCKVMRNLPDYDGGLESDDPDIQAYYLRGFEEWKRIKREFSYYSYMSRNV